MEKIDFENDNVIRLNKTQEKGSISSNGQNELKGRGKTVKELKRKLRQTEGKTFKGLKRKLRQTEQNEQIQQKYLDKSNFKRN